MATGGLIATVGFLVGTHVMRRNIEIVFGEAVSAVPKEETDGEE